MSTIAEFIYEHSQNLTRTAWALNTIGVNPDAPVPTSDEFRTIRLALTIAAETRLVDLMQHDGMTSAEGNSFRDECKAMVKRLEVQP